MSFQLALVVREVAQYDYLWADGHPSLKQFLLKQSYKMLNCHCGTIY